MSERDDERELRDAFDRLRRVERRQSPDFASVLAGPVPRRFSPLVLVAAAVAVALVLLPGRRQPAPELPALSQWRPATDFLLETLGRELLAAPPEIGRGLPTGIPEPPELLPGSLVSFKETRS